MAAVTSYVVDGDDLEPVREDGDTATVRVAFDAANGCERLEQRLIGFEAGRSAERALAGRQEVLYIVERPGAARCRGRMYELEPEMGVYVAPGETYAVENDGPEELRVLSVLAPEDRAEAAGERRVTVRFADQPELDASERAELPLSRQRGRGLLRRDAVLGIVQPSKAPFHSHSYDEVGYVVSGEGVAHVGGRTFPLRVGSCFHLPPDEVHCIENSGSGPMHILGVFHPSGSPANRSMRTTSRLERRHKWGKTGVRHQGGKRMRSRRATAVAALLALGAALAVVAAAYATPEPGSRAVGSSRRAMPLWSSAARRARSGSWPR